MMDADTFIFSDTSNLESIESGIDAALTYGAFGIKVNIVFMNSAATLIDTLDGDRQLEQLKNIQKKILQLSEFEIEDLYLLAPPSKETRSKGEAIVQYSPIDKQDLQALFYKSKHIIDF